MKKNEEFQYYLTKYLTNYLRSERNLSENTIDSYAYTFKLLLEYFRSEKSIQPNRISLDSITNENVRDFLNWLENSRGISKASRNIRLAAIHSFIKYVQLEDPAHLFEYQKILAIKNIKHQTTEVPYLSVGQIKMVISATDASTKQGFRDKVLLTILYDTGARVDELINIKYDDIRIGKQTTIKLYGKGGKSRNVPVMGETSRLLEKYVKESTYINKVISETIFINRSGHKLTRAGVTHIIKKYVDKANETGANITINVHPHVFRHSKAVHLLESGVELIYIRDFLGHSSVKTTEIYAKVCTQNKLKALENVYEDIVETNPNDWSKDKDLMSWLAELTRK